MSIHIDEDILRRFRQDGLRGAVIVRAIEEHIEECSDCRSLAGQKIEEPESVSTGEEVWDPHPLETLPRSFERPSSSGDDKSAMLVQELRAQPFPRQLLLIRNSPRFLSWELVEALLAESDSQRVGGREPNPELAEVGVAISLLLSANCRLEQRSLEDLRARALAELGSTLLMCGRHEEADERFVAAEERLFAGSGDPLERADLLRRRAEYIGIVARDHDEAARLFERALSLCVAGSSVQGQLRVLVSHAWLERRREQTSTEISLLEKAVALCGEEGASDGRLGWIQIRLLRALIGAERWEEAEKLAAARMTDLGRQHPVNKLEVLHVRWWQGSIAVGLGRDDSAEEAFLEARNGLLSRGMGYDAALVSMDLSILYLSCGRDQELKALAAQMLPIFQSRDVHQAALAALIMFRSAVETGKATVALCDEVKRFLMDARFGLQPQTG